MNFSVINCQMIHLMKNVFFSNSMTVAVCIREIIISKVVGC